MNIYQNIIFLLLLIGFNISCSNNANDNKTELKNTSCKNETELISGADSIPIIELDYLEYTNLEENFKKLYPQELSSICYYIDFRIPFSFQDSMLFLKLSVDYYNYNHDNCPLYIRKLNINQLLINGNNDLLFEGELVQKDSLNQELREYLDIEKNFHFSVQWDPTTDPKMINFVLESICDSYIEYVQKQRPNLCELTEMEIEQIKKDFPFRIEVPLGRSSRLIPPPSIQLDDLN